MRRFLTAVVTAGVVAAGVAVTGAPVWAGDERSLVDVLPAEIRQYIFGYLPLSDLQKLMTVSSKAQVWAHDPNLWEPYITSLRNDQLTALGKASEALGKRTDRELRRRHISTVVSHLDLPRDVAIDKSGCAYISDTGHRRVLKYNPADGKVSVFAGTGAEDFSGDGGLATEARFRVPWGLAVDKAGNVYITDERDHRVRKVNAADGVISTIAGSGVGGFGGDNGPATAAQLYQPEGVAVDDVGNVYIADRGNSRIRKVNAADGVISTIAGINERGFSGEGGPAVAARLWSPTGVAVDDAGNVYIADMFNHRLRKIDAADGMIRTVAKFGKQLPAGVAVDAERNIYISEYRGNRIRKVSAADGTKSLIAGTGDTAFSGDGGPATKASLYAPEGIAVDGTGNIYFVDSVNCRVRRFALAPEEL